MNKKDMEKLEALFWKYCKMFDNYDEFIEKKYTREEILKDISNFHNAL